MVSYFHEFFFNPIFGGFLLLVPNLRCEVKAASRDIGEGNEAATEVTTPTYHLGTGIAAAYRAVGRSENPVERVVIQLLLKKKVLLLFLTKSGGPLTPRFRRP